ncbi:MAG: DsrE family protein [Anaerolineae bacterium]|nr:DsrE family protein [Anaerolineae bacterium]
MEHILIHNTNGKDNVERASLAFVVGNVARSANQKVTVLLTIEGVRVAVKGYADDMQAHGFAPLSDLIRQFVEAGGEIWVCGACANPRKITSDDLVEGAKIIGAATAVEALVNGAKTLDF